MVYILCPANYATGGPELLHQLGHKLNMLGFEACMCYYSTGQENVDPVCPQYKKYRVPIATTIVDSSDNVVIIPESVIPFAGQLNTREITRVIWWLSVDNARFSDADILIMRKKEVLHLVQSQYAYDFVLNELQIDCKQIFYLSDYINTDFLLFQDKLFDDSDRSDVVLFNPRKGYQVTSNIIAQSNYKIKWQALNGLTPSQMASIMHQAKVYIDFGNHPGKDRIPREAALCGCCIVTNRKGSANNTFDVAIPDRYKFSENECTSDILDTIYDLLDHYAERKADYNTYVLGICQEYDRFERDVLRFFGPRQVTNIPIFEESRGYLDFILENIEKGDYISAYRCLVKYKVENYAENIDTFTYETAIRIGLQEYEVAILCALQGLKQEHDNYELCLYLAQIYIILGNQCLSDHYRKLAIDYSKGTPDEELVEYRCAQLGGMK